MRCLKCWKTIDGHVAVYTKSCHHVFCIDCSDTAFKSDLSCPLCDTVLTKDGFAKMVVKPDETGVSNSASTMFGFEPTQICETFQKAVQFWAAQKHNEGIKHAQDTANLRSKLDEYQTQNANLLKVRSHTKVRVISQIDDDHCPEKNVRADTELEFVLCIFTCIGFGGRTVEKEVAPKRKGFPKKARFGVGESIRRES